MEGLLAVLAIVCGSLVSDPVELSSRDQVDLIELNHYYDDQGRLVFRQLIFYEWSDSKCRFNIRDFCLIRQESQLPQRDFVRGDYVTRWNDNGTLRKVRAPSFRTTHTQYDPEVVERQYLDKSQRRELWNTP